jgi:hypothetical protein
MGGWLTGYSIEASGSDSRAILTLPPFLAAIFNDVGCDVQELL